MAGKLAIRPEVRPAAPVLRNRSDELLDPIGSTFAVMVQWIIRYARPSGSDGVADGTVCRADRDHVDRLEGYVDYVRARLNPQTAGDIRWVTGFLVADRIGGTAALTLKIERMAAAGMYALDWGMLLRRAGAQWTELFEILQARAPDDARIRDLARPAMTEQQDPGNVAADPDENA